MKTSFVHGLAKMDFCANFSKFFKQNFHQNNPILRGEGSMRKIDCVDYRRECAQSIYRIEKHPIGRFH
jgi:hypothetical protein